MEPTEAHLNEAHLNLGTNEKMQNKIPDYDNFSIFHSFFAFYVSCYPVDIMYKSRFQVQTAAAH